MSEEKIELTGPEVILFIQEHQGNPMLLEELSKMVIEEDQAHSTQLGVETTNVTHLQTSTLLSHLDGFEKERKGYSLYVSFFKAVDRRDPSGWKQLVYFLGKNKEGKINEIIQLGQRDPETCLNLDELGEKQDTPNESGLKKTTFSMGWEGSAKVPASIRKDEDDY